MVKSSDNKSYHKEATSVPTVEQLHITTAGSGGGDLPEDVKDLGRKARARLQEERDKRPEIVRLAVDPPEKGTAHKGIQFQVPNKPKPSWQHGLSLTRTSIDGYQASTTCLSVVAKLAPPWFVCMAFPSEALPSKSEDF
jgi:hypothetical protein